jgi:hypothetical protein
MMNLNTRQQGWTQGRPAARAGSVLDRLHPHHGWVWINLSAWVRGAGGVVGPLEVGGSAFTSGDMAILR